MIGFLLKLGKVLILGLLFFYFFFYLVLCLFWREVIVDCGCVLVLLFVEMFVSFFMKGVGMWILKLCVLFFFGEDELCLVIIDIV